MSYLFCSDNNPNFLRGGKALVSVGTIPSSLWKVIKFRLVNWEKSQSINEYIPQRSKVSKLLIQVHTNGKVPSPLVKNEFEETKDTLST